LIDENRGIQGDPGMTPEKSAEPLYSQLWRSFFR
jgi:hypothetical protein